MWHPKLCSAPILGRGIIIYHASIASRSKWIDYVCDDKHSWPKTYFPESIVRARSNWNIISCARIASIFLVWICHHAGSLPFSVASDWAGKNFEDYECLQGDCKFEHRSWSYLATKVSHGISEKGSWSFALYSFESCAWETLQWSWRFSMVIGMWKMGCNDVWMVLKPIAAKNGRATFFLLLSSSYALL